MNQSTIQEELNKVNAAITSLEAVRGGMPATEIENSLASLRQKRADLLAQLGQTPAATASVAGSGAIAQGAGSQAVGERGVLVQGNVGGSIITGDGGQTGGIRANRIEAENVVQGMQQLGGDLSQVADVVKLVEAISKGGITADNILAKNVVSGLQYIANPAQATPEELRKEVAQLRQELNAALASGETPPPDVTDAQEALKTAESELTQEKPRGNRVVQKLRETTELLTESTKTANAAGQLGKTLIKLAPVAAVLYQIAVKLYGALTG